MITHWSEPAGPDRVLTTVYYKAHFQMWFSAKVFVQMSWVAVQKNQSLVIRVPSRKQMSVSGTNFSVLTTVVNNIENFECFFLIFVFCIHLQLPGDYMKLCLDEEFLKIHGYQVLCFIIYEKNLGLKCSAGAVLETLSSVWTFIFCLDIILTAHRIYVN